MLSVRCVCGQAFSSKRGLTQHQNKSTRCIFTANALLSSCRDTQQQQHAAADGAAGAEVGDSNNVDINQNNHLGPLSHPFSGNDDAGSSGDFPPDTDKYEQAADHVEQDIYLGEDGNYNFTAFINDSLELMVATEDSDVESDTESLVDGAQNNDDSIGDLGRGATQAVISESCGPSSTIFEKLFPRYNEPGFVKSSIETYTFEQGKIFVGSAMDRSVASPHIPQGLCAGLDLMARLRSEKTPLTMYDNMVEWLSSCYPQVQPPPSQASIMREIRKMFPGLPKENIERITIDIGKGPQKVTESLPVVCFDCWPQIYGILNDPVSMHSSNIENDENNPYGGYRPNKSVANLQDGRDFQTWVKDYFAKDGELFYLTHEAT